MTTSSNCSSKPKERRIVTWTQQEDDILREQISLHGTDKNNLFVFVTQRKGCVHSTPLPPLPGNPGAPGWTIIASKFKDKTTRQCRRRWYTYLNSDFKKGGWSPEEDMLLCEAQKIFGNKWTEIAKVVSGRTDNAVKNRFSTLCKKRAKHEAMAKENSGAFINGNNKRVLISDGFHSSATVDIASPLKKLRRAHIPSRIEKFTPGNMLVKDFGVAKQQLRAPFAVLAPKDSNAENLLADKKTEGTFLRKDDPKVAALVQQAELLSSLAVKVNMDNTDQSLENAWKVLQNYFGKSKEGDLRKCRITDVDFQIDDIKEMIEDLRSSNDGIQLHQRQPDMYESPSSSEYSTGSTSMSHAASDQAEQSQPEICTMHEEIRSLLVEYDDCLDVTKNKQGPCATADQEYSSPIQVTPIFRSLASTIPSPQFSESERHFLLKTLGIESPAHHTMSNCLQPPPCRKPLLQGL